MKVVSIPYLSAETVVVKFDETMKLREEIINLREIVGGVLFGLRTLELCELCKLKASLTSHSSLSPSRFQAAASISRLSFR